MKIVVFNCPAGITAEGIARAFVDAGLPRAHLQRELRRRCPDKEAKNLVLKFLKALERGKLFVHAARSFVSLAQVAIAIRYFKIGKCFVRNLSIGRKGNPRTLKLLRGFVLERLPARREIVTPSGAVILATLCEKENSIPTMRLEAVGFGPTGIQVSIGETVAPYRRERILLLETNIDDMNPQGFELLYERLFKAGALDVWVQPILMKKMRPAFKLSALLNRTEQDKISEVVFKETPSLGVRFLELDRFSLPRKIVRVKTRFGPVRAKIAHLDSKHSIVSPEYEDLKRISRRKNLPFRYVRKQIENALSR